MIFAAIGCKLDASVTGTDLSGAHLRGFAAFALTALLSAHAFGCDGLADGPSGTVSKVLDGDTVVLDSGIIVRLVGAKAPEGGGKRQGTPAEPLAAEAKTALEKLVLNQKVRLELDSEETDRYGRMEAQLYVDAPGGAWVQQAMLNEGMARVYGLPKNRQCLGELLTAEGAARANGVGIWADPYYSVHDAADPAALLGRVGHYELIEGRVVSTGEARDRIYLDFGRVWKDDVTATIEGKAKGLFVAAGIDPLALKGKRVRIRGWLESRDGPLIKLSLPEQIEVLGPK
jgi:micrococcal nuclease